MNGKSLPRPVVDPPHVSLRPVAGVYREGPGYRIIRQRGLDDMLLLISMAGEGICRTPQGSLRLPPGSALLYHPNTPHDYGTAPRCPEWNLGWVHFIPRAEWRDWTAWSPVADGVSLAQLPPEALARAVVALATVIEAPAAGRRYAHALAMNALERLLLDIDSVQFARAEPAVDDRIRKVLRTIQRAYADPLDLARLARIADLSPSRFCHLFTEQVGISPMQHLEVVRLERARQLLAMGEDSVARVADLVGFRNAFHFSTRFRRRFGVPPSALRGSG